MRLTPMQQLVLMRDFLRTLKRSQLVDTDEIDCLLQLPLIGAATQLEPELKDLKYWREWRAELEQKG